MSSVPARAQSQTRACAEAASSAQLLRDSGKLIDARAKFVTCAQPACPKIIQKDCAAWQEEVDQRIPTVVVSAKDDLGNDLSGFTVTLDGAPFAVDVRAVPVDPGNRTFRFAAKGHTPVERVLAIREGVRARVVSVVLERTSKPELDARVADPPPPKRGGDPLPFILGGAGIVGGVTFGVLFMGIKSDKDELVGTPAYTEEKRSELETRLVVADVIGAVSAAALIGAIVLFATSAARRNVTQNGAFVAGAGRASAAFRF